MGALYNHFSEVDLSKWRWPNFSFRTDPMLYCPCCGEFYYDENAMDILQRGREILGKPVKINSGHRCIFHNAMVRGAPLSQHKKIAFDVSTRGHDRAEVYTAMRQAGFTTFGFYQTFIHCDTRPGRHWFGGQKSRQLWQNIITA